MERIGLIGGSLFFGDGFLSNLKDQAVETTYGKVDALVSENLVYIQRHGKSSSVPPHKINHKANLAAFKELGIKTVISLNSVGSLRSKIKPGSLVIPQDYINLRDESFFDKEIKHITPGLDESLRQKLIGLAKKEKISAVDWGVYYQTKGPRLETKAEVNLIKNYAEIVGMTMGTEATLAKEMEIKYAAICSVDNYAHGLEKKPLTNEQIVETKKKNVEFMKKFVEKIMADFTGPAEKKEEKPAESSKIYDFINSIRGK